MAQEVQRSKRVVHLAAAHALIAGDRRQHRWFDDVLAGGVNDIELAERDGSHMDDHRVASQLGLVELIESRSPIFVQNRGVHCWQTPSISLA